ncbi:MAG: ABC transporter permease subunit, partial [Cellvibrionaceae bacterium]|nr:ABC transporter permease subunit [Cellvibrionaceae bacterium]
MSPKSQSQFNQQLSIAYKELNLFFASPIGYLFLAVYVSITLFIFFWGESFFARNIADVRPMFEWMPLILIFLCSALTMRMWSEERRNGTLEHVLTLPVNTWQFVVGKFSACQLVLILALLLTLPLPLTISMIANLDWGPVISGYIATVTLGAAYIAIGLYVSSRSDNQIVSLILTCLL